MISVTVRGGEMYSSSIPPRRQQVWLNPLIAKRTNYQFCHLIVPSIIQIVSSVKKECPQTPLVLYINGNGGLIEHMTGTGVDVVGLDWTVDMADGRRRLGNNVNVQGNVDPAYLFSPLPVLTDEIHRSLALVSS
ncbi:hypothetical protein BHE74_00059049 [Ensete ventricosum]|nr:hypothetical protein BHE74_00059049 [Ensete ventricosum]